MTIEVVAPLLDGRKVNFDKNLANPTAASRICAGLSASRAVVFAADVLPRCLDMRSR